jgi:hypothetical protein
VLACLERPRSSESDLILSIPRRHGIGLREFSDPAGVHRKEAFLRPDDPRWPKFDRLTRQEERAGLLDDAATIGTRAGWADRLRERGYTLRGHRLVRCQTGRGG